MAEREIIAGLVKLVKDLADDLEAELVGRYGAPADLHPAMRRRWDRDISTVKEAGSDFASLAMTSRRRRQ